MTNTPTSTTDYLDGYQQGRHDGALASPNEAEADMRPKTGNRHLDDGYADGFHHGRELQRQGLPARAARQRWLREDSRIHLHPKLSRSSSARDEGRDAGPSSRVSSRGVK